MVRLTLFNAELSRAGPGILLRDLASDSDAQIKSALSLIASNKPDILVLLGVDHDYGGQALHQLGKQLGRAGHNLPYAFHRTPNRGVQSGHDLNGDARLGGPEDAHGYGEFTGQGGMAILSRFPIDHDNVQDFSDLVWRDLPQNIYPYTNTGPWRGDKVHSAYRLSTTAHWVVPVNLPTGQRIHLLTWHATPPVFDGPEDRNGKRNHDETAFWLRYLEGVFGPPPSDLILMGTANADPTRGEGLKEALLQLIDHPKLQQPFSNEPTADWPAPGPGKLQVDYILPSRTLTVLRSGMITDPTASRHSLLWVDIALTP